MKMEIDPPGHEEMVGQELLLLFQRTPLDSSMGCSQPPIVPAPGASLPLSGF